MFRNKEYVLAIVREGGISKAAEKLYISQPSLSATVKRIEEKLTVPIFDRTSNPIALTEAGKEYVQRANEIERIERELEQYISDLVNLSIGEIKIGASSLFSAFMLPRMIADFNKKHPRVRIKIFENNTKNLMRDLAAGELDLVIDNVMLKNEALFHTICASEILLLAVPDSFSIHAEMGAFALRTTEVKAGMHLDAKYAVELERFADLPFVLLNSENDTGNRADFLFKKHLINPNILFRLDQQITAYNISSSGLGICFVSDTLVKNMEPHAPMRYYRLSDSEIARNIYFYQKKNQYRSIACQKFIEHITNCHNN
ncbi:MAG: LysR family transcriptional regulator [Clostridia bacterium]|nr:LysR family transcriptional regulator [Clostridia bacterium]